MILSGCSSRCRQRWRQVCEVGLRYDLFCKAVHFVHLQLAIMGNRDILLWLSLHPQI
jgi:hypothetical protein